MSRLGRALLACLLTFGLIWGPFAHALAMTRTSVDNTAAQTPQAMPACHHAAAQPTVQPTAQSAAPPAAEADNKPARDDCCCHKGSQCHCATAALALPSGLVSMSTEPVEQHFMALSAFLVHALPAPEPPPPRSLR